MNKAYFISEWENKLYDCGWLFTKYLASFCQLGYGIHTQILMLVGKHICLNILRNSKNSSWKFGISIISETNNYVFNVVPSPFKNSGIISFAFLAWITCVVHWLFMKINKFILVISATKKIWIVDHLTNIQHNFLAWLIFPEFLWFPSNRPYHPPHVWLYREHYGHCILSLYFLHFQT